MALGERVQQPMLNTVVGSGTYIGLGQNTIDFTGTFVTGNDFDLTINGVAITQVPFNTDHDTTMRDIADSISALATVTAHAISSNSQGIKRILVQGDIDGLTLTYTGLSITGGATQPTATISDTSGSLQEQPALLVIDISGVAPGMGVGASEATSLNVLASSDAVLAQVTSKINRIKGSADYSAVTTYFAVGTPGSNPLTITHTGTTVLGAETIIETITYNDPSVAGSNVTNRVYS